MTNFVLTFGQSWATVEQHAYESWFIHHVLFAPTYPIARCLFALAPTWQRAKNLETAIRVVQTIEHHFGTYCALKKKGASKS